MTIDELISQLNAIKRDHGNIDVRYVYNNYGICSNDFTDILNIDVRDQHVITKSYYDKNMRCYVDDVTSMKHVKYVAIV